MRLIYSGFVIAAIFSLENTPVHSQARIEMPLSADNCAIQRALSPETMGNCNSLSNGQSRGIVLRIDDVLKEPKPAQSNSAVSSVLPRLIAPTVRVAVANKPNKPHSDATMVSRAAAPSKDGYFIQFSFDSAALEAEFKAHLDRLSDVLRVQAMATTCIKIIGHTDTVGDARYNLRLSDTRAQSVATYLRDTRGISPTRISTEAAGETRPLPNISGEDALNRRVEFATKESINGC